MKFELNDYHRNVSDEELLSDLRKVSDENAFVFLSSITYRQLGAYCDTVISRRFGSWNHALELAGLPINHSNRKNTDEELFKNIEQVWISKGKQPVRSDMNNKAVSNISSGAYLRRFETWTNALRAFVEWVNTDEDAESKQECIGKTILNSQAEIAPVSNAASPHSTPRDINLRLRFRVMQRDNFKCCICGASPAKDPSVELHIDHIVPWAKGGETTFDNLQTLCSKCNLGKSDLLLDENT